MVVSTKRRKPSREMSPVSSASGRDTTPSKAMRPLGALDRRSDGHQLGACPSCGGLRWWDDRSAKRAGQRKASDADFTCVDCRHPHRESDPPNPAPPSTTQLAPQPAPAPGTSQCVATTATGERCKNGAMSGSDRCGPHAGGTGSSNVRPCQGRTKAGKPCRAGAQRGEEYCPAHADQAR